MTKKELEQSKVDSSKSKIDINLLNKSVQGIRKKYEEIAEESNPLKDYSMQKIRAEDLLN